MRRRYGQLAKLDEYHSACIHYSCDFAFGFRALDSIVRARARSPFFFVSRYGDHRVLHVLTHSFPTRRSSDRACFAVVPVAEQVSAKRLAGALNAGTATLARSEEHTSELQSLRRISYAVFC